MTRNRALQWASLLAALFLLNASLSFENLWPTPAITWHGRLSIELIAAPAALLLIHRVRGLTRRTLALISAFWVILIIGHYADVTAPALYGRDVNLYWDLRYIPDVAAMVATAAPLYLTLAVVAGAAVVMLLLYLMVRWAFGRLARAATDGGEWRAGISIAAVGAMLFAAVHLTNAFGGSVFAKPVIPTYARQARLIATAWAGRAGAPVVAPTPPLDSRLSLVKDADVLLVFVESYGAVSYDRLDFARALAPGRSALDASIRGTNRGVVSAFVESPTFGGSSWLAHLSLMSGVEVRDPDSYALLMSQRRDSMVTAFSKKGFRTIALMPGLKNSWPEGAFYGFDDIYDERRLDYRGPWFGWFGLPDQFSIGRLDHLEEHRGAGSPLFVFFPTLSTHFPFGPTPPYQTDWTRVTTEDPYDAAPLELALEEQTDWDDFGPAYVKALSYAYQSFAGYLRLRANRDFVVILMGDHQPPAVVTGEGASWDVPVHVIANREAVLDRLVAQGFHAGLTPARPHLGKMHELLPILLSAFN